MPIKKAVFYTQRDDSFRAGKFAMEQILSKMGGESPEILLLFTTTGHDIDDVLAGIRSVGGDIPLCGCTGSGVISQLGCDEATHSLSLVGIQSEGASFEPFLFSSLSQEQYTIGERIAEKIQSLNISEGEQCLLFLFPDGLTVDAQRLLKGITGKLDRHVDCVGGTAGNDYHMTKTYQFCGDKVCHDGVSGLIMHGDFHYEIGLSHGSKPFGSFRTITRAEGNVIYEVDHKPALTLLQSILGQKRFSDFGHMVNLTGLGVDFDREGYPEGVILRAVLGINAEENSIRVGTTMKEGTMFRFNRRDKFKILEGTNNMARKMVLSMNEPDNSLYIYFNCSGRGAYLFGEADPDVHSLLDALGGDKDVVGFFTFGEFAPIHGENFFHNYTGILVGLE